MLVCLLEGLAGVTVMVDGLASPTRALSTPLNLSEIFSTFENKLCFHLNSSILYPI